MRVWNKFHSLFGPDLKVGFETTFPKEGALVDPLYEKSGLVHESSDEPIRRIYEPACEILGSCLEGEAAQVFFEPVSQAGSLFRRLVFARKMGKSQRPRLWMVAARHGEPAHFGFDSWNSRNERYLSLAFPGLNQEFIPVYFKIQTKGGDFVYLEVWAWGENKKGGEEQVIVQARRVTEEVPESLVLAKPELVYSI